MSRLTAGSLAVLTVPPLLWAGNTIVGRLMVGHIPPLSFNALRWALAFVLLLPLGWRIFRRPGELIARWPYLLLLGGMGVGSYNALQYLAVQTSTPINVTLIAASMPLWMMAVGRLLFGVRATAAQGVGALLSLLGVALVLSRGQPATLLQLRLVPGDLYILLAAAMWAVYSWMLAKPPASLRGAARPSWNWAEFLLVQVTFGAVWASVAAAGEMAWSAQQVQWSGAVLAAWIYVALAASIVAYWFWGIGVTTVGPATSALFVNLTPVFVAVLSAALLHEWPQWFHIAAFALIAAGIVINARSSRAT